MSESNFHVVECAQKKAATMMQVDHCTTYTVGMLAHAAQQGLDIGDVTIEGVRKMCEHKINNTRVADVTALCNDKSALYQSSDLIRNWNAHRA